MLVYTCMSTRRYPFTHSCGRVRLGRFRRHCACRRLRGRSERDQLSRLVLTVRSQARPRPALGGAPSALVETGNG